MPASMRPVTVETSRGRVACRYTWIPGTRAAALFVGGVGGGWDTPANDLYPRLAEELAADAIASLRVRFRDPTDLDEAVFDVLAGGSFLVDEGRDRLALVGHSFGGAVVIRAAAALPSARTVVTLATQGYGAAPVRDLGPRCSVLLVHGTQDRVLPPSSSEYVYELAREPKRLVLYEGAGHGLVEAAAEVRALVRGWIVEELRSPVCRKAPAAGRASGRSGTMPE